jgi:hypothetical protein
MAPEIQEPEQGTFSSIRADRWSNGKILHFLKKSDRGLGSLEICQVVDEP